MSLLSVPGIGGGLHKVVHAANLARFQGTKAADLGNVVQRVLAHGGKLVREVGDFGAESLGFANKVGGNLDKVELRSMAA